MNFDFWYVKMSETWLHNFALIHYLFMYSQQKYSLCGFGEIQRDFPFSQVSTVKDKSGPGVSFGRHMAFRGFV